MTGTPDPLWERWADVDRLLDAALDRPAEERGAFIEHTCGADAQLRDILLKLLQAEADSQERFVAPGRAASHGLLEHLAGHGVPPARIGRYTVVRELGRGGVGTVYLAEHEGDGFRQQVAIKVLRRGVDTDDVLRRFVNERRILASLSHPGIAQLHDSGTADDGRPFLVMEYVDGEPIADYCDRHQVTVRRRLSLVADICDAVRAAHAKLVVHRDLKPSNILVTADGHVKLLDFGIAKLLDHDVEDAHTRTGLFVLTPEYASPEQLRGEPITTATDVYQLGALLFRLLTGRSPRRQAAGASAQPVAGAEPDPPRPSTVVASSADAEAIARVRATTPRQLRRLLTGDLDRIVGKAMRSDPSRRYASVEELARDIRRHLEGRTISARRDTLGYRARTFARRNPWVAPAAVALVLFAIVYLVTQVRHTRELEAETARAREVQQFLVDLFASADPYAPADPELGQRIRVVDALDVGTVKLQSSLKDRPAVRAAILSSIARVYESIGAYDRARPLREEARDLQTRLYGDTSREVRDSMGALAVIHGRLGLDGQLDLEERRLELALADTPIDPNEVAAARLALGRHLTNLGRSQDAQDQLLAILSLAERGSVDPVKVGEATQALAEAQRELERFDESAQTARRAIALIDAAAGPDSVLAGFARGTLGQTLGALGRFDEAGRAFQEGLERLERGLGSDHDMVILTKGNQALFWLNAGRLDDAERLYRDVIATLDARYGPDHLPTGLQRQNLGVVLMRQGRMDEAREHFEALAAMYRRSLGRDEFLRALPLLSLADIHLREHRYREAEHAAREALETLQIALPQGHYITGVAECRIGRALTGLGRAGDARPHFARAVPSIVDTRHAPDYREECLAAAADHYAATGDAVEAARLRAALDDTGG